MDFPLFSESLVETVHRTEFEEDVWEQRVPDGWKVVIHGLGTGPGGSVRLGDRMLPSRYSLVVPEEQEEQALQVLGEYDRAMDLWVKEVEADCPDADTFRVVAKIAVCGPDECPDT